VSLLSYVNYYTNAGTDVERIREQVKRLMALVKEYNELVEGILDHGRRVNLHKLSFAAFLEIDSVYRVYIMPHEMEIRKYHGKYEYTAYEYIHYNAERCRRVEVNEQKSIKRTWDIDCTTVLGMLMPVTDEMARREKEVGEVIQKLRVAAAAMSLQS
jgi:hypothetical protein